MQALQLVADWPVRTVAAAVVAPDGSVATTGPIDHSVSAGVDHQDAVRLGDSGRRARKARCTSTSRSPSEGCTLRHLLAHAGGYAFDGNEPIARPG